MCEKAIERNAKKKKKGSKDVLFIFSLVLSFLFLRGNRAKGILFFPLVSPVFLFGGMQPQPSFVVALGTSGTKRARAYDGATGKPIAAPSAARIKFLLAVEAARLEVRRRDGEQRREGERDFDRNRTIDLNFSNLDLLFQKQKKQQHNRTRPPAPLQTPSWE